MATICLRRPSSLIPSIPVQIPLFLVPAFSTHAQSSTSRCFSTTPIQCRKTPNKAYRSSNHKPKPPGKNKSRGVSAIRRTGPAHPLAVDKYPLPVPVIDPARRAEFATNPDHGLWEFFDSSKAPFISPEAENAHGRSWTYAELALRSFEDLHALYWTCIKERNQIHTREMERLRVRAGYGDVESGGRKATVSQTMRQIREVLRDRYHSWEDAMALINQTPVAELPLEQPDDDHFEYVKIPEPEVIEERQATERIETPPARQQLQANPT